MGNTGWIGRSGCRCGELVREVLERTRPVGDMAAGGDRPVGLDPEAGHPDRHKSFSSGGWEARRRRPYLHLLVRQADW